MRWICKRSLEAPQRYEWAQAVLSWLIYLTRTRKAPNFTKAILLKCDVQTSPPPLFSSLLTLPSCFSWLRMSLGVKLSLFFSAFILFPERAGRHRLSLICHFVHGQQDQRDGGRGWLHLRHERKLSVNHVDIFAADVAALRLTQSWKRNIYKSVCFSMRIKRSSSVGLFL